MSNLHTVLTSNEQSTMEETPFVDNSHKIFLTECSLILNGDGWCRTDWLISGGTGTVGFADYFVARGGTTVGSVITGGGFRTRAQRVTQCNKYEGIEETSYDLTGDLYDVSFKYRSSHIIGFGYSGAELAVLPANTDSAKYYHMTFTISEGIGGHLGWVIWETVSNNGWIELDEINLRIIPA
jgi:hypothetical protein